MLLTEGQIKALPDNVALFRIAYVEISQQGQRVLGVGSAHSPAEKRYLMNLARDYNASEPDQSQRWQVQKIKAGALKQQL